MWGDLRCSSIGNLICDLKERQHLHQDKRLQRTIRTTSTPRFLATATTVLSVPKSTPTTVLMLALRRAWSRWGKIPLIFAVSVMGFLCRGGYVCVS